VSTPFLILRPEPGAAATARRVAALGRVAVVTPLFTIAAQPWEAPAPDSFDALMLTSAHAARLAGPALATYAGMPLYAVGAATADAARAAGLPQAAHIGDSDGMALVATAARNGVRRLLHLAGREHRPLAAPGVTIERRIVYAADAVAHLPEAARGALARGAIALVHSPRAAALLRRLMIEADAPIDATRLAAISANAHAAAGYGWHATTTAAQPTDDALLAAAARLCD
jgi:uroporphyrinogen-III synthase